MGKFTFSVFSVCLAFLLLSSCSVSKPASRYITAQKQAPVRRTTVSSGSPKYINNIAIGSKGGNKINMDVGNKERKPPKAPDTEVAGNRELVNNNDAALQSIDLAADDSEKIVLSNYKAVAAPPKPEAKSKKHRRRGWHKDKAPAIDLDTEPLVDVVPRPDSIPVMKPGISKPIVIRKKDGVPCQVKYAGVLCTVPQALSNLPLYNFIDDWYGVDYQMGGSDKDGIDCSAFVQRLYLDVFGFSMVRTALEQYNNVNMVYNIDKLKEGDLVFFHIHSKKITHVGVYLMNHFFVHASVSQGVVISSLNDEYWSKYFAGAGEILEEYAPLH